MVETSDVIELSAAGSLWIYDQYIAKGRLDDVEAVLKRHLTDRDAYGAVFENDAKVLERLWELNEQDRVLGLYKSAIQHRFKALKEEGAIVSNAAKGTNAAGGSRKWVKNYSPKLKAIIKRYEELLSIVKTDDPELESIKDQVSAIDELCR